MTFGSRFHALTIMLLGCRLQFCYFDGNKTRVITFHNAISRKSCNIVFSYDKDPAFKDDINLFRDVKGTCYILAYVNTATTYILYLCSPPSHLQ